MKGWDDWMCIFGRIRWDLGLGIRELSSSEPFFYGKHRCVKERFFYEFCCSTRGKIIVTSHNSI